MLEALLAVSSLSKYGYQDDAVAHKIAALHHLGESTATGLDVNKVVRHGVASLLLSTFEVGSS